jgi:hypothetical protein
MATKDRIPLKTDQPTEGHQAVSTWTLFAPIREINKDTPDAVIEWLKDRSSMLVWFTSIITGSLVVLTVFGKKPGFESIEEILLSISLLLMFVAILCNLICVWQIPKWKLGIRLGMVSDGRKMTLDLEITSWLSLTAFLAALVLAAVGNSGL